MRIGCLTGGGDAVGLNAAVAALVRGLSEDGVEIIGILGGWQGLTGTHPECTRLSPSDVMGIVSQGGTVLHTSRENPLKSEDKMQRVISNFATLGLDGLVAMGGDDTLSVANELSVRGLKVIGVPKTMDLDLSGTQYSVGFWSYVESVVESLRGFISTCTSHRRIGVCEVFGRHSGFTAAAIGIATDADYIIVPEQELSLEKMVNTVKAGYTKKSTALVVLAEGIKLETGSKGKIDPHDNEMLSQKRIGEFVAKTIEEASGIEAKSFQAAHPFRGMPYAYDSVIGYRFGAAAADMVLLEKWGQMVALVDGDAISGKIALLPISSFKPRRLMDADSYLYHMVASRNDCVI